LESRPNGCKAKPEVTRNQEVQVGRCSIWRQQEGAQVDNFEGRCAQEEISTETDAPHCFRGCEAEEGGCSLESIRAAGARLFYLPPYSPDRNPIEQAYSKPKHWLRTAKERSIDDACQRIASILETFSRAECANYVVNAGYRSI